MNDSFDEDRTGAFRALLRRLTRNQKKNPDYCVVQYLQARMERAFVGSTIDRSTVIERVAREMACREDLLLTSIKNRSQQSHHLLQ